MSSRGSALSRTVKYFKEEDLDVAIITLKHISNIIKARIHAEGKDGLKVAAVRGATKKRAPRRTKAEMAAAKLAVATGSIRKGDGDQGDAKRELAKAASVGDGQESLADA